MTVKLTVSGQPEPFTFDRPILVMVEGRDDQAVLERQLSAFASSNDWHIHAMEGNRTSWGATIDVVLESDFAEVGRAIALIQDADDDTEAVFRRLQEILSARSLPVPRVAGEVAYADSFAAGIFILPGEGRLGTLEDLMLETVDPARRELAQEYIENVSTSFGRPKHPTKNAVVAYIAGHTEHVRSFPVAVQHEEMFPVAALALGPMRVFLRALETEGGS